MANRLRWLALCGLVVTLCSCVELEHPLSDVTTSEQDARLYGAWTRTQDGGTVYLAIGAEESEPLDARRSEPEKGLMRYWAVELNDSTHRIKKPEGAKFFCTKVGNEHFATWVAPTEREQHKSHVYFLIKYHVDDKHLTVWAQDVEATAKAIESGKLKGTIKRKTKPAGADAAPIESIRLTEASDGLVKFLAEGGAAACFLDKNKVVYDRLR